MVYRKEKEKVVTFQAEETTADVLMLAHVFEATSVPSVW
jgi:hypothetical protein